MIFYIRKHRTKCHITTSYNFSYTPKVLISLNYKYNKLNFLVFGINKVEPILIKVLTLLSKYNSENSHLLIFHIFLNTNLPNKNKIRLVTNLPIKLLQN